ncbi:DnaJ-like protein 60 [Chionoecetes opilio]|uniref:DnaJ-like protein 60 n=1 Tax=Chionoecetes opilio TaxID=41210 RepID=A0A8J4YEC5_CHIOP|nr:DnaJ-like protein 60 [Chionoecetes opilio]
MQTETLKQHVRLSRRLLLSRCGRLRCHHPHTLCTLRVPRQNHYDILGLKKDCTAVEVKDQFIRLSKECHPDTNPGSSECHQRFVAINAAYSVLNKPGLRQAYDSELQVQGRPGMQSYGDLRTNAPRGRVIFRDDSLWEHRDKAEFAGKEGQPYYGLKGVNKRSNSTIAAGAVVFMVVGAIIHFSLAKTSSDYTIKQLNLRDQVASQHHTQVRERAKVNGNELQMALLKQRTQEANKDK